VSWVSVNYFSWLSSSACKSVSLLKCSFSYWRSWTSYWAHWYTIHMELTSTSFKDFQFFWTLWIIFKIRASLLPFIIFADEFLNLCWLLFDFATEELKLKLMVINVSVWIISHDPLFLSILRKLLDMLWFLYHWVLETDLSVLRSR
jgi:hypothetical protein